MKKFTITLLALLAIVMQASAAEYDLYVFGHKVTDNNRSDILGDGTVTYNSSTNMLTFNNATINAGSYECVYNKINGLTIRFIGTNKLTSGSELAINSDTEGELTLTGTGSVYLKGYSALRHAGTLLKIEGGLQLTAEATTGSGIYTAEIDYACDLEISGATTKIRAFSPRYPFANFYIDDDYQGVTLKDGLGVTEPEGARFHGYYIYDKNGNSVQNQWVTISEMPIEGYAVYTSTNKTLTFYYDNLKQTRSGKVYSLVGPQWYDDYTDPMKTQCQHVVFDSSFADFYPTSLAYWFYGFNALKNYSVYEKIPAIKGMEYLNTSEVTTMQSMFDSSNIGPGDVDFSLFDTRKVTNMMSMFFNCTNIYSLDLSTFDTQNVTRTGSMFNNCKNLETIYVDDTWTMDKVSGSFMMFDGCTNLKGERGTTYDENHTDAEYAHVDGGTSNPGYLTLNHRYPLWVMGQQVTDRNYQKVVWNDQMAATEYLTHCYAKFDGDHVLHLHRIGNHSITGKGNHIIANGDIERGIPGIDGLVVVIDGGYMALTSEDDAIVVNANTTIMGLQNGYSETVISSTNEFSHAIHIGENITLNLTDFAKAKLYAPRFTIFGEPNSILNVSYSDVMVEPTSKNRERCSIAGMKELNFDGSYFCEDVDNTEPDGGYHFTTQDWYYLDEDGTKHQFSGYIRWENFQFIGAIRLGRKDLGTKSIFIRNGLSWTEKVDDMGFNYTTLLAVISSREGWTNLFDQPVLEEKYQDGSYYYYRCSDNKLMFYTQGGAYHLTPDAEPLTMDLTSMNANYTHDLTTENELNTWIPFLRYSTLYIGMGNPTEIETAPVVDNANQTQPVYNLSGQRVGKAYKGIAIQNGRKVVMK